MKPVRITLALALAGAAAAALPGAAGAACAAGCTFDGPAPVAIDHTFIPTGVVPTFVDPVGPTDAVTPTDPGTSTSPNMPSDATAPTDPITPSGVVFPSDPLRPNHKVHLPTAPITPTDAVLPAHPTDPVPTDPVRTDSATTSPPPPQIQVVLAPSAPAGTSPAAATVSTGSVLRGAGRFQVTLARGRVTDSGLLRLRVTCAAGGPRCVGVLGLHSASRVAGRARFSLAAGERGDVNVVLTQSARRTLASEPILIRDGILTTGHGTLWRANLRWWINRLEALVPIVRGDSTTPIGTQVGRGQCTDWALDRRPDLKGVVSGDAWRWTDEARKAGLPVSKTPHVGDVVVFQPGVMGAGVPTGHVAYVESVQRDANGKIISFTVSEQNFNGSKSSTTRTIQMSDMPPNGVDFIG